MKLKRQITPSTTVKLITARSISARAVKSKVQKRRVKRLNREKTPDNSATESAGISTRPRTNPVPSRPGLRGKKIDLSFLKSTRSKNIASKAKVLGAKQGVASSKPQAVVSPGAPKVTSSSPVKLNTNNKNKGKMMSPRKAGQNEDTAPKILTSIKGSPKKTGQFSLKVDVSPNKDKTTPTRIAVGHAAEAGLTKRTETKKTTPVKRTVDILEKTTPTPVMMHTKKTDVKTQHSAQSPASTVFVAAEKKVLSQGPGRSAPVMKVVNVGTAIQIGKPPAKTYSKPPPSTPVRGVLTPSTKKPLKASPSPVKFKDGELAGKSPPASTSPSDSRRASQLVGGKEFCKCPQCLLWIESTVFDTHKEACDQEAEGQHNVMCADCTHTFPNIKILMRHKQECPMRAVIKMPKTSPTDAVSSNVAEIAASRVQGKVDAPDSSGSPEACVLTCICKAKFASSDELSAHGKVCDRAKEYSTHCPICNKWYKKDYLFCHMLKQHNLVHPRDGSNMAAQDVPQVDAPAADASTKMQTELFSTLSIPENSMIKVVTSDDSNFDDIMSQIQQGSLDGQATTVVSLGDDLPQGLKTEDEEVDVITVEEESQVVFDAGSEQPAQFVTQTIPTNVATVTQPATYATPVMPVAVLTDATLASLQEGEVNEADMETDQGGTVTHEQPISPQKRSHSAESSEDRNNQQPAVKQRKAKKAPLQVTCLSCFQTFSNHTELSGHKRSHCPVLNQAKHKQGAERTGSECGEGYNVECSECGHISGSMEQHKEHQKQCGQVITCLNCYEKFYSFVALRTHKSYHCPLGKNVRSLKTETASVSEESQQPAAGTFCCTLCDKEFSLRSALYDHMKSSHDRDVMPGFLNFYCPLCQLSFASREVLRVHKETIHNVKESREVPQSSLWEQRECQCGQVFEENNIQLHQSQCPVWLERNKLLKGNTQGQNFGMQAAASSSSAMYVTVSTPNQGRGKKTTAQPASQVTGQMLKSERSTTSSVKPGQATADRGRNRMKPQALPTAAQASTSPQIIGQMSTSSKGHISLLLKQKEADQMVTKKVILSLDQMISLSQGRPVQVQVPDTTGNSTTSMLAVPSGKGRGLHSVTLIDLGSRSAEGSKILARPVVPAAKGTQASVQLKSVAAGPQLQRKKATDSPSKQKVAAKKNVLIVNAAGTSSVNIQNGQVVGTIQQVGPNMGGPKSPKQELTAALGLQPRSDDQTQAAIDGKPRHRPTILRSGRKLSKTTGTPEGDGPAGQTGASQDIQPDHLAHGEADNEQIESALHVQENITSVEPQLQPEFTQAATATKEGGTMSGSANQTAVAPADSTPSPSGGGLPLIQVLKPVGGEHVKCMRCEAVLQSMEQVVAHHCLSGGGGDSGSSLASGDAGSLDGIVKKEPTVNMD